MYILGVPKGIHIYKKKSKNGLLGGLNKLFFLKIKIDPYLYHPYDTFIYTCQNFLRKCPEKRDGLFAILGIEQASPLVFPHHQPLHLHSAVMIVVSLCCEARWHPCETPVVKAIKICVKGEIGNKLDIGINCNALHDRSFTRIPS